jgi:DNA-binding NarL/FixJ family response regulator
MSGTTIDVAPGCDHRAFRCLTPRQTEVLALMAEGHSNAAIAEQLVISEKAVVQHTSHIYDRLDIVPDDATHRRVVAVVRYLSYGPVVSRLAAAAN